MTTAAKNRSPKSREFDDVYFSEEGGLEECTHVFLTGNNLPARWQDKERFVICEAGFGTGLNFLATWKLFEETAEGSQALDFVSFEKFPLNTDEIKSHLERWRTFFNPYLDELIKQYPPNIPGFHRLTLNSRVTLTLIFDDINDSIPNLEAKVDAWFLDGFKPSLNADMWSDILFKNMARLSQKGVGFATYTAAGHIRRALADAGFLVERTTGYGSKRHMTIGSYKGTEA